MDNKAREQQLCSSSHTASHPPSELCVNQQALPFWFIRMYNFNFYGTACNCTFACVFVQYAVQSKCNKYDSYNDRRIESPVVSSKRKCIFTTKSARLCTVQRDDAQNSHARCKIRLM